MGHETSEDFEKRKSRERGGLRRTAGKQAKGEGEGRRGVDEAWSWLKKSWPDLGQWGK
jgi:hypothetical protein